MKRQQDPRAIRLALGRSLVKVAALADTSPQTVRLFEIDPVTGVANEHRRKRIAAVYESMDQELSANEGKK